MYSYICRQDDMHRNGLTLRQTRAQGGPERCDETPLRWVRVDHLSLSCSSSCIAACPLSLFRSVAAAVSVSPSAWLGRPLPVCLLEFLCCFGACEAVTATVAWLGAG